MTKTLITFFEHEKKTFKDLEKDGLSKNEIKKLIKLNDKLKIFNIGYNSIKAKQYVGVIKIKNMSIQILPKIYKNEDNEDIKQKEALTNLLYILSYTNNLKIKENIANLAKNNDLFEIYTYLFAKNLLGEIERGIYRDYNKREENLSYLKGKLNINKQIKHNLIKKHKLYCTHNEFSENNSINQILKYTVELLKNITKNPKNKKLLNDLSFIFEDVEYKIIIQKDFERITFNRMNERFKPYIKMAELFIKNSSINLTTKDLETFSLIFNMEILFEKFIGNILRKYKDEIFGKTSLNVYLQYKGCYLMKDDNGNEIFALKPDVVIKENDKTVLIIDTKYKKLINNRSRNYNISQPDIYQMFAYLKKYNCKNGILLYPKYEEEINKRFKFDNENLYIKQINLKHNSKSKFEYINLIKDDLKSIINNLER
ncbi:5-methylcytosine restriction system component-like protein [Methanocaldococcus bathoardescens]|uniref:5-methylcytosine restriction system component-like protein n=1 Tax=Methanocaldococcus bathoardescens TaxID=1301915 RepID=A0A076LII3_9EURY|nr:McrC family protein [Methanocaldococcus bathoardescens]AIJ06293.1 5-methylcytosine restriction system component-like protein [Methanocaldococcus bathoardescens]